jgi:hypothetical protein
MAGCSRVEFVELYVSRLRSSFQNLNKWLRKACDQRRSDPKTLTESFKPSVLNVTAPLRSVR